MGTPLALQYAFRSQKELDLIGGDPSYESIKGFQKSEGHARTYQYSPDGGLFAYVVPSKVCIINAEDGKLVQELEVPNIIEVGFSPKATFLSTWERPVRPEDGSQHKNLRVFSVASGQEVVAFTQKSQEGWNLQYTNTESHAIRLVGSEVQVFSPADWSKGVIDKLKVDGCTNVALGPGLNPHLAVFVAEKNASPAVIRIFNLITLNSPPTSQKSFYKADRATIKWNALGTQVLVLTQTDVDKTNKSYYGETGLYLLTASGSFECRVTLDKEGPIHDFAWSPNSKEFGVVYGYMPAKTVLFDQRVRPLHDFGLNPINFISFNPQGRLIVLGGFGNLAGKVDLYDRRTLTRVCTIDAPNTSWCEWSPDGRFLLTATLSPRLRVDNGIKIWHCTGPLVHVQMIEELYQASWRPIPSDDCPPFPVAMPISPPPSPFALKHTTSNPTPSKPAGAYRPPGARGLAAPSIYKREDEGGTPTNGQGHFSKGYGRGSVPGAHANGNGDVNGRGGKGGRRPYVPGAPPPSENGGEAGGGSEKRGKQKRKKKEAEEAAVTSGGPEKVALPSLIDTQVNTVASVATPETPSAEGGALDPIAKKVRNLTKKIKAIEELKEKAKRGERLEVTQLKKIETEVEIRRELEILTNTTAA